MQNARAFSALFQDPVCRLTMSPYLMDLLQAKLQNAAFTAVSVAFRPAPQLPLLATLLGFSSPAQVSVCVSRCLPSPKTAPLADMCMVCLMLLSDNIMLSMIAGMLCFSSSVYAAKLLQTACCAGDTMLRLQVRIVYCVLHCRQLLMLNRGPVCQKCLQRHSRE